MEYLRGYRVMREDPDWLGKMGVVCLILMAGCIPVIPQLILYGWQTLMLRRAVSGQHTPLPRLDLDFNYLMKLMNVGFKTFLARMLWSLPIVAAAMVFVCCLYMSMAGAMVSAAAGAQSGSDAGAALGGLGSFCLISGSVLLYLVAIVFLSMPMQIAVTRAELTDDLNAAMRFGDVIAMTKLLFKELLIGNLVMMGMGLAVAFVGVMTLYLALLPGAAVMIVIGCHWQAQLYQRYLDKGGVPLKIGPLDVEPDAPAPQPGAGVL